MITCRENITDEMLTMKLFIQIFITNKLSKCNIVHF